MKLFTLHSPSHQAMFDNYFKPSLIPGEYELISNIVDQECPSGSHYEPGWDKTTYRKVELFVKIAEENMGEIVLFSDVDIQFFGPTKEILLEELGDYDMGMQSDGFDMACSGWIIFRCNDAILAMFKNMLANFATYKEDQIALNSNRHLVRWKYLSGKFFTIFHTLQRVWAGEQDIIVPQDILVHHANWCYYKDKIALLELVKKKKLMN
jgi:hypothetical protein